ncbi:MAG: matrixin family metalloprotease [Bacteroidetes bacterium]|nr:matrixin family metalloprotease [Bacteroidota bacterium]
MTFNHPNSPSDVTVIVENIGTTAAPNTSYTGYYLSEDPIIEPFSDYFLGEHQVPPLGPGATDTHNFSIDFCAVTGIPAETYYFGFYIDWDDLLPNEPSNNNWATWTQFPIVLPCGDPEINVTPTSLTIIEPPPINSDQNDKEYMILLKNRQFEPSPQNTITKESLTDERNYIIMQFYKLPQPEMLNAMGIEPLNYVPKNAIIASVPANFDLKQVPDLRWAGKLLPSDKLSRNVQNELNIANSQDRFSFLVYGYNIITQNELEQLIRKTGGVITSNQYLPEYVQIVTGDKNVFYSLASSDLINWIIPASERLLNNQPVYFCPGAMTPYGPIGEFVIVHQGWDGTGQGSASLTYYFVNGTPDISGVMEEIAVEDAFSEWATYVQITFTETSTPNLNQSLNILWGSGEHGDGFPFDGPGGVLAHAFFPANPNPETIAGDMHFDEDEFWSLTGDIHMFAVALHEAGHSLGMGHSDVTGAVMFAFYGGPITNLQPDDIAGIQSIYASNSGSATFEIQNVGMAPLTITSITDDDPLGWLLYGGYPTTPFNIAPGASQTVSVSVNWNQISSQETRAIKVASTDLAEPTVDVDVTAIPYIEGEVIARVLCSDAPTGGSTTVGIEVDMNGMDPPNDLLGSFTATFYYPKLLIEYTGHSGPLSGFVGNVVVNESIGLITFNGANPSGASGIVPLLDIDFDILGSVGLIVDLDLEFSAMSSTSPHFLNLLPLLTTNDCSFTISPTCNLGDVTGDDLCNSTDALVILTYDVGSAIPQDFLDLINNGCGDINNDGFTNSTDALIILSCELGLNCPFPFCDPLSPLPAVSSTIGNSNNQQIGN